MDRILESELMVDEAQTLAYAQADFDQVNQGFVDRYRASFPRGITGDMVDLGCGPGDIPIRFAQALPGYRIIAVDGSGPMVLLAQEAVKDAQVADRVQDLFRPESPERAREVVERYAADETPVLKEDFYNSLCAAFTLREIRSQIRSRGLGGLVCELASDRHWVVWGHLPRGVQKTPPP